MAQDPTQIDIGPGLIYAAPLGTVEPTTASAFIAAPPVAWRELGYSEAGWTFTDTTTTSNIEVAEEFYPVETVTTGKTATLAGSFSQVSIENLAIALNLGANYSHTSTFLEPPAPGTETRVMLIHQTNAGAIYLLRRCFQSGAIAIPRQKAPNKSVIPVTFTLEKPSGAQPWRVYPNSAGLI